MRSLGGTWSVVVLADRSPTIKPTRGRTGIDAHGAARDVLVFSVVVQAVNQGIADLPWVREIATMIAVGPYAPASASDGGVEKAIRAHGEALHAAREGVVVVGLDDEMEVIVLDGELDDAKVLPARSANRALECGEER